MNSGSLATSTCVKSMPDAVTPPTRMVAPVPCATGGSTVIRLSASVSPSVSRRGS